MRFPAAGKTSPIALDTSIKKSATRELYSSPSRQPDIEEEFIDEEGTAN